MYLDQAMLSR